MFSNNMSMTQQGIISPESELIDAFLAAIYNDNAVEFEVLDQIAELEEILTLNMISAKHETLFDVSALKQERNTWRLIGRLYHDELMQAQNTNDSIGWLIYTFSNF